ncbi:hypothetical protein AALA17_06845 [Lactobacillaceae bacterium 24-114]
MSKNLLIGALLGGTATYVAWKLLSEEQREKIKANLSECTTEVVDNATDYALNALDIVDEKLAEREAQTDEQLDNLSARFNKATDKVKDKAGKMVDRFTNDDFDKQTENIRQQLAKNKKDEDIIIDATNSAAENDNSEKED